MNGKRMLGWAAGILIILAVINNPTSSAASARHGMDALNQAGSNAATFLSSLGSNNGSH